MHFCRLLMYLFYFIFFVFFKNIFFFQEEIRIKKIKQSGDVYNNIGH